MRNPLVPDGLCIFSGAWSARFIILILILSVVGMSQLLSNRCLLVPLGVHAAIVQHRRDLKDAALAAEDAAALDAIDETAGWPAA